MEKLAALADAVSLKGRIQAMWRGDAINTTEGRAVLHVALRQSRGAGIGGAEIEKLVLEERERMLSFARARAGRFDRRQLEEAVSADREYWYRRVGSRPGDGRAGVEAFCG